MKKRMLLSKNFAERDESHIEYRPMPWFHHSGVISYLLAALELEAQFQERNIGRADIFMVAGHRQTGLQLAAKLLGLGWRVTGVAQAFEHERPRSVADWSRQVVDLLGLPVDLASDDIKVVYDYAAPGFHKPSEASRKAVELVGRTEGVALDPMYTGKAMAALIDYVSSGSVDPDTAIVFIHTGGLPMLFDSRDMFE